MNGQGVFTTSEGDVFKGRFVENTFLNEEVGFFFRPFFFSLSELNFCWFFVQGHWVPEGSWPRVPVPEVAAEF